MTRRLIAWLSKRFPEQLVVTPEAYAKSQNDIELLGTRVNELRSLVISLDAQVKRLNDQQGFVSSKKGAFALER